jgi:hypothetical protein
MTPAQSKELKIGLHVARKNVNALPGTVIGVSHSGVQIKWDDGKISDHRHDEMQDIRLTDWLARHRPAR